MTAIFLSHRSLDDDLARQLEAWLGAQGFGEVFADHDKIVGGDKWRDALKRAQGACRIVLCLVTPAWLESDQCFGEFVAGSCPGKKIIPLLLLGRTRLNKTQSERLAQVLGEDQGIYIDAVVTDRTLALSDGAEAAVLLRDGLRAGGALVKVGLDPCAFAIDAVNRPQPFPGLESFGDEDADAAIFFGRSAEISLCLEELRQMRATGDRRAYAIQGASGSGKSSLMKAGVLPRLRRERGWLVLRTFRPGADPMHGLADAIARTAADLGETAAPGVIRERLLDAWRAAREERERSAHDDDCDAAAAREAAFSEKLLAVFDALLAPLKAKADRASATVLLAMDQGEELARAEGESGEALGDYLRCLLRAPWPEIEPPPYAVVLTVRDDSFPELRASPRFEGVLTRTADIRTLPIWRFSDAIEQPARRYKVDIAADVVQALIDDAPERDALPLLAFAMRQLWVRFAPEGVIARSHYESLEKLTGLLKHAAERALRGMDPNDERPLSAVNVPTELERRAAHLFVPALAQLNERGAPIRRVAEIAQFDDEDRKLIAQFQRWYLIVSHSSTIEVAHESMFREWPRFRGWLEVEKARLDTLRGLESAAAAWGSRGRNDDDLLHRARRLGNAQALTKVDDYRRQIERNGAAQDYLAACRMAERRRLAVAAGVLILLAAPFAVAQGRTLLAVMDLQSAARAAEARAPDAPILSDPDSAAALPDGAVFRDCPQCPEMVILPSGRFMMGSPTDEPRRGEFESPRHEVTIRRFAIGKYSVTFAEWDACVADGGCDGFVPNDGDFGRGNHPVINVRVSQARTYLRWISRRTGQRYRFLSDAEWEYAARARTETPYYTGQRVTSFDANFNNTLRRTQPVGTYPPNQFGLYDMIGNVWTRVQDCWHDTYDGAPSDGSAWDERDCDGNVVMRGGAWGSDPTDLRSANRVIYYSEIRNNYIGFRIARDVEPRSE